MLIHVANVFSRQQNKIGGVNLAYKTAYTCSWNLPQIITVVKLIKDRKVTIYLLHGDMELNRIFGQFSSRSNNLHVPITKKYTSLQWRSLYHMSVRHLE